MITPITNDGQKVFKCDLDRGIGEPHTVQTRLRKDPLSRLCVKQVEGQHVQEVMKICNACYQQALKNKKSNTAEQPKLAMDSHGYQMTEVTQARHSDLAYRGSTLGMPYLVWLGEYWVVAYSDMSV
jgi:hypothetical protein